MILLLFVIFANIWFWKIVLANVVLAILLLLISLFIYKSSNNPPRYGFLTILFLLLCIFQYRMTSIQALTSQTKNEEVLQIQRIKEYPPTYISFGSKTFWIPGAHWLEGRREMIVLRHITENIFGVLDLNLYFFSSHPRERVGYSEFEKFPYILLPFFIYGIYIFFNRNKKLVFISFLLPLSLFIFIGSKSELGPFAFFPFIVCTIVVGLQSAFNYVKGFRYKKVLTGAFVFTYILVFIQVFSYAFY